MTTVPLPFERRALLMKRATYASVGVVTILVIAKTVAWLVTDSVSVLASLLDSLLDAAASLINLVAVRHAQPIAHRDGMDDPRMFWVPSISPSSIMFYSGDKFPRWKNNLFVGALSSRQLVRVAFGQPSQAERREGLLIPIDTRPRDVQQSPDGFIYVVTEQASGGNAADGMVLRIEPAN